MVPLIPSDVSLGEVLSEPLHQSCYKNLMWQWLWNSHWSTNVFLFLWLELANMDWPLGWLTYILIAQPLGPAFFLGSIVFAYVQLLCQPCGFILSLASFGQTPPLGDHSLLVLPNPIPSLLLLQNGNIDSTDPRGMLGHWSPHLHTRRCSLQMRVEHLAQCPACREHALCVSYYFCYCWDYSDCSHNLCLAHFPPSSNTTENPEKEPPEPPAFSQLTLFSSICFLTGILPAYAMDRATPY